MTTQTRRHVWTTIIDDFDYSLRNSSKDFILRPEIFTRKGEVELMVGLAGAAYDSFRLAREHKPDYWPAYSKWAAVLIKSGQKVDAKKLVKEGLEHSPDSEVLRTQYKSLGEDPGTIKPIAKPAAPAPAGQEVEGSSSTPAATDAGSLKK